MTLGNSNHGGAVELAGVTHVVQVFLSTIGHDSVLQVAQSLLGADDGSSLAASSSFDMSNQVEQLVLVVSASFGEVSNTTHLLGGSASPQSVNIVQQVLTEGLSNLVDEVVEVNTTGQHTVQFLINLDHLQRSGDRGLGASAQSLTTDTLSTVSSLSHDEQVVIFDNEQVLVALSNIAEVDHSVEEFVALQALDNSARQDGLNQGEQTLALAVTNLLVVQNSGAAVSLDQSLTQDIHRLVLRILFNSATISIDGELDNIIHFSHCYFLLCWICH